MKGHIANIADKLKLSKAVVKQWVILNNYSEQDLTKIYLDTFSPTATQQPIDLVLKIIM